ncbi:xanthine dehydrogenase accessory protein XdhC [Paucibacter sp. TC2R-5]|uniref:xanthine dehydrogenase accessory protein XdhC n=1 Tax=Paucibacter sp. TC2R-5 TaxID=2893555 RepID=UPI0021E3868E|nr:xanthine dehydrogenase accessory protein XdhC [Paucibacter sp. TC2R-5]MCV2359994.1 xanthine dehydrogenase accessory protein XdhC [Paucibacter sp. TC2R-5]
MAALDELQLALHDGPAVLVQVTRVQGSGPREVGAWMALTPTRLIATIGGGHLEFEAIAHAKGLLEGQVLPPSRSFALGPSLGQCCGGVVDLSFELLPQRPQHALPDALPDELLDELRQRLSPPEASLLPVGLFGGGHVGRAIIELLTRLPSRVQWFDSRDEVFPSGLPAHVRAEHSEPVQAAVQELAPGSRVLIMSFSHAEDLDVLAACLLRQRARGDLAFIGLIGSKSKWASFSARLRERGFSATELAQVTCPIGLAGIAGKQPELIALAVVAQLFLSWQCSV